MFTLIALTGGGTGWFPVELPPAHPILVNFTAALLPISLICDVLGRILRKPSLQSAAWWTLLFGAAITPFTALAGWIWLRHMPDMDMPAMRVHQWLGTALAVVLIPLAIWRARRPARERPAGVLYLVALAVCTAALVLQGHLGGSMSFGDQSDQNETARAVPAHESGVPSTNSAATQHTHQWRDHIDVKE